MTNKPRKSLTLLKEVVFKLTDSQLNNVKGGNVPSDTSGKGPVTTHDLTRTKTF